MELLRDREYLIRPVAFDLIDMMTKRIHVDGIASDGAQIGTYSPGYMKVRTGDFKNSVRFVRGAQKGQVKNAGTFTDATIRLNKQTGVFTGEEKSGTARPNYNRTSDTKIIVSLTRQLENDWSVIATEKGYGIGFLNQFNLQKARWVEEGQGTGPENPREIFSLTKAEQEFAVEEINRRIDDAINGRA